MLKVAHAVLVEHNLAHRQVFDRRRSCGRQRRLLLGEPGSCFRLGWSLSGEGQREGGKRHNGENSAHRGLLRPAKRNATLLDPDVQEMVPGEAHDRHGPNSMNGGGAESCRMHLQIFEKVGWALGPRSPGTGSRLWGGEPGLSRSKGGLDFETGACFKNGLARRCNPSGAKAQCFSGRLRHPSTALRAGY